MSIFNPKKWLMSHDHLRRLHQQAMVAQQALPQQVIQYSAIQQPGAYLSGQHWQSSTQTHSSTAFGAGGGAGGTTANFTHIPFPAGSGGWAWVDPRPADPPTIPYAGIRTGEIIGRRFWWVLIGANDVPVLSSFAHFRVWTPGETVSGDIHNFVDSPVMGGVYSFSDSDGASLAMTSEHQLIQGALQDPYSGNYRFYRIPSFELLGYRGCATYVQGTIKCWGDVVEHETGWRAQYAKIVSLDSIHGQRADDLQMLHNLRTHYDLYREK